jgi:HD-GYP domain-containing protein (c-di-GMP phosphodiesterase class II)
MLKKIATADLRRGMYVHQLCGSWLDHPFWRKRFLLEDAKQLAQLHASAVREVWIDTARGDDVFGSTQVFAEEETVDPDDLPEVQTASRDIDDGACSLAEELVRARRIVGQARGSMSAMFQDARLGRAIDTEHCMPLVNDITDSVRRNPGAIVSLARLKTSDDYTYMHSVAVCALMVCLARQLDLSEEDTREAGMAGLIHDLGKSKMPLAILNKHGPLTTDEFAMMKSHPEAGYRLLTEAGGASAGAMDVALHHHEKFDGTGYPHGLAGDDISVLSRMGAICDVYDAITSQRPYKSGWDPSLSIRLMARWTREGQFDEAIFQAFVKGLGIYPIGSLVRLSSQRLAIVVDQSTGNLLAPVVRVFFDVAAGTRIAPELIDLSKPGSDASIAAREDSATWGFTDLDDLWSSPVAPDASTTPVVTADR